MLLFFLESFSCVEVASAKLTAKIRIFSLCYFLIASPFVCWFCVLMFEFHVFFRLIFSVLVLLNYCKIVLPSGLFCIVTSTHSFSRNSSFLQLKSDYMVCVSVLFSTGAGLIFGSYVLILSLFVMIFLSLEISKHCNKIF